MYVLVRKDLPPSQIVVQTAHATIEATRTYISPAESCGQPGEWQHPNLVVCGVESETKLLTEWKRVVESGIRTKIFHEADRNNEATAFATEIISGEGRKLFRKYQLLKL